MKNDTFHEEVEKSQVRTRLIGSAKNYFICPTCSILFLHRCDLEKHLERKLGCISLERVFDRLLAKKLQNIECLIRNYDLSPDVSISSKKQRLLKIRQRYDETRRMCDVHMGNVHNEDKTKALYDWLDKYKAEIDRLYEDYYDCMRKKKEL